MRFTLLTSFLCLCFFMPYSSFAQQWSEYAFISQTLGVNDGRLCVGEASRGELGCPSYAPYVSTTSTGSILHMTSPGLTELIIEGPGDSTNAAALSLRNTSTGERWFLTHRRSGYFLIQQYNGSSWLYRLTIHPTTGNTGLGGIAIASTTLHISGTLRIAAGSENCDTNRTGAIKYQSGDFFYCRNGTGWESLTSLSGSGSAGDRIISGTTGVYASQDTSLSLATAGVERMVIGTNGEIGVGQQPYPGAPFALSKQTEGGVAAFTVSNTADAVQFIIYGYPSDTASSYLRDTMMLYAPQNTQNLQLTAVSSTGVIRFTTGSYNIPAYERMRIATTGIGIGILSPTTQLEVSGTISTTVVRFTDNPPNPCDALALGTVKNQNGKLYMCRQ